MNVNKTAPPAQASGSPPVQRGKEPPAQGFDALLALHNDEARTAPAEGQTKTPVKGHGEESPEGGERKLARADGARPDAAEAVAAPVVSQPQAETRAAAGQGSDGTVAVGAPVVAATATPVAAPELAAHAEAVSRIAAQPIATTPLVPAGVEGDAGAAPNLAALTSPSFTADGAQTEAGETPQAQAHTQTPVDPTKSPSVGEAKTTTIPTSPAGPLARSTAAPATPIAEALAPTTEGTAPAAPTAATAAAPAAETATAAPADKPATAPATPAVPASAEAPHAPATPAAPAIAKGNAMFSASRFEAVETIQGMRDLAHVAAARGAARARLQLHPAELGAVDVRLKVTAEGVTAQIQADRPEAVQALQQAGAELKRALEDRGLTVLSFDVDVAPGASHGGANHDPSAQDRTDGTGGAGRSGGSGDADTDGGDADLDLDPTTPAGIPAGALVDVLA